MANQHYPITNGKIKLNIPVEVELTSISNYQHLSVEDLEVQIENFKNEIGQEIKRNLSGEFRQQDVLELYGIDYVNYRIS